MNPSSYLTKNVCEQNTTGSNLVPRVCRSAGKGFLALWLLGDVRLPHAPEKISTIDCRMSIRGKGGLRFPYLPFSSTIISICIFWPEEIFRGKVLHCNGAIQKLSAPPRSRLALLVHVFPHLVSCFQIIPDISTSVIFIQNETLKFRLLFINFVSFSDYIVAIKEVN